MILEKHLFTFQRTAQTLHGRMKCLGTVLICSLLSAPSFAYATESAFRSVNSYLPPLPRIRSEGVYGHFWGLAAVKSPNNVKNLAPIQKNGIISRISVLAA